MALPGQVTNPQAVLSRDVKYGEGELDGYLARPRAPGRYPGVIVIQEIFGVNEHIRDVTRRFANAGYITLAPNLFARLGPVDVSNIRNALEAALGLEDAQMVGDLGVAAAFLRAEEGAGGKVGCIGFCFGGRESLLLACSSNRVDAAVDCWGGFISRATPEAKTTAARPVPVIDLADRLQCPLLAVFGAEDQNPSPADAAELRARLEQAHKTATVKIFEGAGHAFFADYRPTYREGPAFELWRDVTAFFKTHLGV